jgi:hypothetical protein
MCTLANNMLTYLLPQRTAPKLLSIFYQASSTTRNYGIAEGLFLCGLNKF